MWALRETRRIISWNGDITLLKGVETLGKGGSLHRRVLVHRTVLVWAFFVCVL